MPPLNQMDIEFLQFSEQQAPVLAQAEVRAIIGDAALKNSKPVNVWGYWELYYVWLKQIDEWAKYMHCL